MQPGQTFLFTAGEAFTQTGPALSEKDEWHFEYLDWEVSQAQQHGVEMTLILYNTPTWASARPKEKGCCTPDAPKGNTAEASNIEDWRNYVRKVATVTKGEFIITSFGMSQM